ncbi:MAG TPA: metallophosphoesterase family protein [Myxococcota bacterium]|nr:metallophosphoesterase family protein [Myxococcota bacterium]
MYLFLFACSTAPPESGHSVAGDRHSEDSTGPVDSGVDMGTLLRSPTAAAPDNGALGGLSILPHIGHVSATTATVWVRLSEQGRFRVLYQAAGGSLERTAWRSVAEARDYTGQITLHTLLPATAYSYVVEVKGGRSSPVRSFSTLPPPGEGVARVGLMADGRSRVPTPIYGRLAAENLDMVLQIGDFDHRDPYDVGGLDPEAWWDMYRDLLGGETSGQDLQRLLLPTTPLLMMWDDHDYGSDNGHRNMPYRDVARSAFAAYVGRDVGQNGEFWTRVSDGPLDIFLLDLRSERDDHQLPDGPDKSMIGELQWSWLKAELLASTAPFKLLVSTVPLNPTTEKTDAWYGYENERQRLLRWLQQNHLSNVVVVSGDIHTGGAIDDGSHSGLPEMNLPTMNLHGEHVTAPVPGSWSEGVYDGDDRMGYGVIEVRYDSGARRWACILSTFDELGRRRQTLRLLASP